MKDIFSWLFDYPSSLRIEVSHPCGEAVERLRDATTPYVTSVFSSDLTKPSLVGFVSKDDVQLRRVTFMYSNIFKPIFVGKFIKQDNKLILVGDFKMGSIARIVTYIFVGFLSLAQLLALPSLGSQSWFYNLQVFDPLLFIALGFAIVYSGKLIAKSDISWIENRIRHSLSRL